MTEEVVTWESIRQELLADEEFSDLQTRLRVVLGDFRPTRIIEIRRSGKHGMYDGNQLYEFEQLS